MILAHIDGDLVFGEPGDQNLKTPTLFGLIELREVGGLSKQTLPELIHFLEQTVEGGEGPKGTESDRGGAIRPELVAHMSLL